MKRGRVRAGAVVALLAFAPVAAADDVRDAVEDAPRADSAPLDMPPEQMGVAEVGSALFWMRLNSGKVSPRATKGGPGVYFTREAYERANEAFKARGAERDALRARVAELEARTCPVAPPCASEAYPPPAFLTGRWPTWAVVGVGVLALGAGVAVGLAVAK